VQAEFAPVLILQLELGQLQDSGLPNGLMVTHPPPLLHLVQAQSQEKDYSHRGSTWWMLDDTGPYRITKDNQLGQFTTLWLWLQHVLLTNEPDTIRWKDSPKYEPPRHMTCYYNS
jgi:hypothetical protein